MEVKIYNYIVKDENHIMTIQIKPYKQLKRIVDELKQINKDLMASDFKNNRIRYYIYKVDHNIILSEDDLENYDIKH
jgi:hypothetical protein